MIVEDGTIVANADSYVSVAEADEYLAARGRDAAWSVLSEAQRASLLLLAADHMAAAYRSRWRGWRTNSDQSLDWPRQGVVLTDMPVAAQVRFDAIPREIKAAQIELAWRQMPDPSSPLMADLARGIVSESVGPLSTTYDTASPQQTRYALVDNLLAPYLQGAASVRLGRS